MSACACASAAARRVRAIRSQYCMRPRAAGAGVDGERAVCCTHSTRGLGVRMRLQSAAAGDGGDSCIDERRDHSLHMGMNACIAHCRLCCIGGEHSARLVVRLVSSRLCCASSWR